MRRARISQIAHPQRRPDTSVQSRRSAGNPSARRCTLRCAGGVQSSVPKTQSCAPRNGALALRRLRTIVSCGTIGISRTAAGVFGLIRHAGSPRLERDSCAQTRTPTFPTASRSPRQSWPRSRRMQTSSPRPRPPSRPRLESVPRTTDPVRPYGEFAVEHQPERPDGCITLAGRAEDSCQPDPDQRVQAFALFAQACNY